MDKDNPFDSDKHSKDNLPISEDYEDFESDSYFLSSDDPFSLNTGPAPTTGSKKPDPKLTSPEFSMEQNDDDDVIDFLLTQESELGLVGILPNIEDILLNKDEFPFVFPRIAKLFNFISSHLEVFTNLNDPTASQTSLESLSPFMRLLFNVYAAAKYTQLSFFCMKPPQKIPLKLSSSFFQEFLEMASKNLSELPTLQPQLIQFLEFAMAPSDVFALSIQRPYQIVFAHFLQNLYENPSKQLFKFLSQVFLFLPHSLVSRFCEDLLLPTLVILESGLENTERAVKKGQKGGAMDIVDEDEIEQNEIFAEIAKVLTLVQVNAQAKKTLLSENAYKRLYSLLRGSHSLINENKKLKIPLRCSLMIIETIVCLLQGCDKLIREEFAQDLYKDILQSLERQGSKFISNVIFPMLSAPPLNVVPICVNIDQDADYILSSIKSGQVGPSVGSKPHQAEPANPKTLASALLTSQERNTLLANIQKLSLGKKKKKGGVAPAIESLYWKKNLQIDFDNPFGGNPTDIRQALTKAEGVLFVFHCLVGQEIAKLGLYCNSNLVQHNLFDAYSTQSGGLRATQAPENFLFYYTDLEKLHFPTNEPSKNISFPQQKLFNHSQSLKPNKKPVYQSQASLPNQYDPDWEDDLYEEPNAIKYDPLMSLPKSKGLNLKNNFNKVPCVEYSDHRIALFYDGKPVLEYFPSNPDTSKVSFEVWKMWSVEEKAGKDIGSHAYDSSSVCFVQGVEVWTVSTNQEAGSKPEQNQDFLVNELTETVKASFSDVFRVIRSEKPVYLVDKGSTLGDFLVLLFKGKKNVINKIELRCAATDRLTVTMKIEELVSLFEGSEYPQVLDLFISSSLGAGAVMNEMISPEEMNETIMKRDNRKSEEELVKYLMTKERARTLLAKIVMGMEKGNKNTSKVFREILEEMQVFWSINTFEDKLAEDHEFFGLVLDMLGNTSNKQAALKLNQRAYGMLEKLLSSRDLSFIVDLDLEKFISTLLKKLKALDKEAEKDGIAALGNELMQVKKLKKEKEANKGPGGLYLFKSAFKPYVNNLFGMEESKDSDLADDKEQKVELETVESMVNEVRFSVITCLLRIMEIQMPEQIYERCYKQIKDEKLMATILRFLRLHSIGEELKEDLSKPQLQIEILNLLSLWSKNEYLSELFWEEMEGADIISHNDQQQKTTVYQGFMEFLEHGIQKSSRRKKGNNSLEYAGALFQDIDSNLRKLYDINVTEKTSDITADLALPLSQSYPKCLKPYCVDSTDILSRNHHYKNSFSSSKNPSSAKVTRITKELSDLASSLPVSATNAILVRYDSSRMDVVKALIFGSAETPYGHGAFEYDIYIGDEYPNNPPLVNLMTTGNGAIRFNPNLYACGKVCLSLLGTWRGQGNENWKPNMSTILQVLISIQSLLMTEDVYYNEPGFEASKSTAEGKRLNEGYSNIVKYANVRYAMVEALKNPPPCFKEPILIHFYLKKQMIMDEVNKWLSVAKNTQGVYTGLVNSHNATLALKFQQNKDAYFNSLQEATNELQGLLDKLNLRIEKTFTIRTIEWKRRKQREKTKPKQEAQISFEDINKIDVAYDEKVQHKTIDLKDEKVTNRWSRYIGALGLEAVEKQANSCVLLVGLNALGVEIAKNVVLSGVKKFTVCDWKKVEVSDLAGQFFLSEKDIGKNRAEACLNKLQALNQYVHLDINKQVLKPENLNKQLGNLDSYNILVCCEGNLDLQVSLGDYCRSKGVLFISATVRGLFSRVFCDFGASFTVVDKTGEEQHEFVVKEVSPDGVVSLLDGVKHGLQDNDKIMFVRAEETGEGQSFLETTHTIQVKNKNSFQIGDVSGYKKLNSGIIKTLKKQETLTFKPFLETLANPPLDYGVSAVDFLARYKYQLLHVFFLTVERYIVKVTKESKAACFSFKRPLDIELLDSLMREALKEIETVSPETLEAVRGNKELGECMNWINWIVETYDGVFPPLCAFIGGIVSQEIIKGITRKYTPIRQYFYYECSELYENNRKPSEISAQNMLNKYEPVKLCIGEDLFKRLQDTKLFMVGAGAIGCELLKNYAMLGLASNKGKIMLTDPDVIESSNLNRQFLFREKHIRKPKASTAAAVAVQMNPDLQDKVLPMLEKVHEASENIFTPKFFEDLDVVTNALDNVQARRYVDSRCVKSRTPLLESGTLGPKGHVQVIIPFKTESYGSQQDPQEDNEIPYCTLKMFPEETLHCIEWARDKFTKMFTQKPSSFLKALEAFSSGNIESLDEKILKEAMRFGKNFPKTFEDCVQWAVDKHHKFFVHDIQQLLYTYPLDFKTADGQLFWSLPKRAPTPMHFNSHNPAHMAFVASCACLRAVVCGIEVPKGARQDKGKQTIVRIAEKLKPKSYKISEEKAKELKKQNDKENKDEAMVVENGPKEEEKVDNMELEGLGKEEMITEILNILKNKPVKGNKYMCLPQDFEKDEDENFHVDVLHAMTNCRAGNYSLEAMDWLNVKLKAGRIIPALATTTAAIAGLQTIELCKLLAKVQLEKYKNSFLNLSIPVVAQSEPMTAPEYELRPNLKVNIWDRWEVQLKDRKDIKCLRDLFKELEKTTGLQPLDLLRGNTPIYVQALMDLPGKGKEKESVLGRRLMDVLQVEDNEKYVDVTVTFTSEEMREKNPKDINIKGTPPVRIYFA